MFKTCLKLSPLSTVMAIHFEYLEKNLLHSDNTSSVRIRVKMDTVQIHFILSASNGCILSLL